MPAEHPPPWVMAQAILDDETGQKFEAYYAGIRLTSTVEPTRELARSVLQNVADGHYFDGATSGRQESADA